MKSFLLLSLALLVACESNETYQIPPVQAINQMASNNLKTLYPGGFHGPICVNNERNPTHFGCSYTYGGDTDPKFGFLDCTAQGCIQSTPTMSVPVDHTMARRDSGIDAEDVLLFYALTSVGNNTGPNYHYWHANTPPMVRAHYYHPSVLPSTGNYSQRHITTYSSGDYKSRPARPTSSTYKTNRSYSVPASKPSSYTSPSSKPSSYSTPKPSSSRPSSAFRSSSSRSSSTRSTGISRGRR